MNRGATGSTIAALLVVWSCTAGGQTPVDDQRVREAVELLNRVDEVLSFKRSTEIIKQRTAALERLPNKECQGLSSAKFRLETAGQTNGNLIDAELAMSKAKRFVAERRLANEDLENSGAEDFQAGRTAGEVVAFVSSAFKAQLSALSDQTYLVQFVEAERVADDCKTQEYIAAEHQNEIAANQQLSTLLTSQGQRLRALMQRSELNDIMLAQADFNAKLNDQRQRNPEAAKARARVDGLRKGAETPELLKSRADVNSAMRNFVRGR